MLENPQLTRRRQEARLLQWHPKLFVVLALVAIVVAALIGGEVSWSDGANFNW